ncbi:50S ribosomal protein L11 methyltransferase [Cupriavidus taiwanensis]|uniref:Ribosomal protein L11 methyltransferase n=2 Tax=Cupriavidus taiwanensis TaxID=164546 RepID=PRMA_CUPTR|nr:50S ribosomal protein L11 methyltransferase [Cupriavidus taiwanensis]B3R6K3.1 RecName: Full=Ribosomal protein L11 methyltransferase; Short=L11 Mtase [Cupriavidus taiwanensis LMG 19424]CAQ70579.1 Ribosomal protein L11 methyltransferase [Cupriavidus taiwanensis LMG 19424]SOY49746.1 Ribosomal protein L11 methyltransferase [Cupriavidus taiwanensis]SOY89170.1 Ribosomal protein L11 methyltransferase [Cupriavidus taiwanensis]SOZ03233.1 Ribosomal protein L11 methyltransferase [Cupriavidus taiwanens
MAFQECVIEVAQDQAEAWSDALFDLGALSVSVEDADADTPDEQPLFGEPGLEPKQLAWNRSRVVALFGDDADPAVVVAAAANQLGIDPVPPYQLRAVEDQDWVRLTQSQFEPIRVGERIWVVPSWHDAPEPDAVVLELDPGLAFGTGSHPTTRLCMQWLEQNLTPGETVLDYGCGSGILAIVARKLGAGDTVGIDIDPNAVEASRYNAERNHVEASFALPESVSDASYDLVVANILSNPLKLMAAMLSARVRAGGRLVLSGVLERQAEEVAAAYAPWLPLTVWRSEEGWVCLHGTRP